MKSIMIGEDFELIDGRKVGIVDIRIDNPDSSPVVILTVRGLSQVCECIPLTALIALIAK